MRQPFVRSGRALASAPRIRIGEVLRYLGYGGQEVDPALQERIELEVARCDAQLEPRFVWRAFDVEPHDNGEAFGVTGTTLVLSGSSMKTYLAGACGVALVAGTLGARSEAQLRLLGATDPLGQLIYDAACTDLIEWGADQTDGEIAAYARERAMICGMRYGPGYGDLSLEVQPVILDVLQAPKRLGLTTTEGHLLVPAKSITALVGLYPAPQQDQKRAPGASLLGCEACNLRSSCQIRARGQCCHRPLDRSTRKAPHV